MFLNHNAPFVLHITVHDIHQPLLQLATIAVVLDGNVEVSAAEMDKGDGRDEVLGRVGQ